MEHGQNTQENPMHIAELSKGRDLANPRFGGPQAGILFGKREVVTTRRIAGGFGESKVRLYGSSGRDASFWGLVEEEDENKCGYGERYRKVELI
ncbi:hypothetical protein COLO4_24910 [Corchorus olitorius]|uniref:Uncharacterized protein n=1 Tax=Corchorus olitorius TaxID=93759 RepID=A0A1R3I5U7_9ROSI|nr:hypothetical protein COLO4_24910 [Corchorus olitorius]